MVLVHQISEQFCCSGVTGMMAAFIGGVMGASVMGGEVAGCGLDCKAYRLTPNAPPACIDRRLRIFALANFISIRVQVAKMVIQVASHGCGHRGERIRP